MPDLWKWMLRRSMIWKTLFVLLIPWHPLSLRTATTPSLMNFISHNALPGLIFTPIFPDLILLWLSPWCLFIICYSKNSRLHTSSWYLQESAGSFLHFESTVIIQPFIKMFAYMPMQISYLSPSPFTLGLILSIKLIRSAAIWVFFKELSYSC